MIIGLGIDIIEINRIAKAVEKNNRFMGRVFTKKEIDHFKLCNWNISTIAGSFAAKEAIMKSLGTGLRDFKWTDIEIHRNELGKPFVLLKNNAKTLAEGQGISNIMISISHSREYAIAQAIAT